jgi:WD40 repeat protein
VLSARWVAGSQILTAGSEGTARLWDGSTGQLRQIYQGGSRFLADATLAPDGLVMAGGADGLLRFWDAASGRLLWALQAALHLWSFPPRKRCSRPQLAGLDQVRHVVPAASGAVDVLVSAGALGPLDQLLHGGDERVCLPEAVAQEIDQVVVVGVEVVRGWTFR